MERLAGQKVQGPLRARFVPAGRCMMACAGISRQIPDRRSGGGPLSDRRRGFSAADHSDLDRIDADVLDHGLDLGAQDVGRHAVDGAHALGVLRGECSNSGHAKATQGRKGNTNAWPIDILTKGDLYVADAYGKISGGSIMGATLANSIISKSGNGVVFNGAARDLQEIRNIKGFNAFVRDFHPSFTEEMVLMGLNTPIRIGNAIVLPGDLVIASIEGVLFVPAHMAEQVVSTAEFVIRKDQFGFEMVREGIYSTGEIDSQWTPEIKAAFLTWLKKHPELGTMTAAELDQMMSKRTW